MKALLIAAAFTAVLGASILTLLDNIHESARHHSAGLNPVGHSILVPGHN